MNSTEIKEGFLTQFSWKPYEAETPEHRNQQGSKIHNKNKSENESSVIAGDGFNGKLTSFLFDVLNQEHECSDETTRAERSGIRSAATRSAIIKKLEEQGLIRIWKSAISVGRGRPMNLIEPTELALNQYNVKWKKTRGNLPTRVATKLVYEKTTRFQGLSIIKEGTLRIGQEAKQVDFLVRNESNEVLTIEIAGNASHEIHNAAFALRGMGLKSHIIIAIKTQVLNEVKKKLQKHPTIREDKRLRLILLSQFLNKETLP